MMIALLKFPHLKTKSIDEEPTTEEKAHLENVIYVMGSWLLFLF
jgi:hypothetical protein